MNCLEHSTCISLLLCSTILPLALSCAIFCESKSGSFFTWLIQSGRGKFSKQPIWKGIESWHASKENPPAQAKNAPQSRPHWENYIWKITLYYWVLGRIWNSVTPSKVNFTASAVGLFINEAKFNPSKNYYGATNNLSSQSIN